MVSLETYRVLGHIYAGIAIIAGVYFIGDYFVALHPRVPDIGATGEDGVVGSTQNYDVINNNLDEISLVKHNGKVEVRMIKIPPEVYLAAGIIQILLTTMFIVGVETATLGLVRAYRRLFLVNGVYSILKSIHDYALALDSGHADLISLEFGVAAFSVVIFGLGWWILNGVIRYVANERITRNIILVITPQTDTKALI